MIGCYLHLVGDAQHDQKASGTVMEETGESYGFAVINFIDSAFVLLFCFLAFIGAAVISPLSEQLYHV